MNVLLLGSNGQVGFELSRTLRGLGTVTTAARSSADYCADLAAGAVLVDLLDSVRPQIVVNACAYTAVDQAETDRASAWAMNHQAVRILADYCRDTGGHLVHYSTDYVFDGAARTPLQEEDPVAPINAYGASKLAGEEAIRGSGCSHFILRTAWVYAGRGRNFLRTMLRLVAKGVPLRVVADQVGAPTWARMLAELTAHSLAKFNSPENLQSRSGTYHVSAGGQTTWHGFAEAIFDRAAELGILERAPQVERVSTAEFPTKARRPVYSVLDNQKFERTFGLSVPHWTTQLRLCIEEMAETHDGQR